MKEEVLVDYVLVPMGVVMMGAYHTWLLHRIIRHPNTTIIGVNAINRRYWVSAMMQDVGKNGVLAVQTLRNNIMASTLLASTAIMLSSLIAVLMTAGANNVNGNRDGNRHRPFSAAAEGLIFLGDKSESGLSLKFFCILVCFLAAFLLNVQSIRYYSHASVLINVPINNPKLFPHHHLHGRDEGHGGDGHGHDDDDGDNDDEGYEGYVARIVNRGSYFWSLGLRAFYFSFPLFLWIFGPIPMFLCCLLLVFMLYFLDMAFHSAWVVGPPEARRRSKKLHVVV